MQLIQQHVIKAQDLSSELNGFIYWIYFFSSFPKEWDIALISIFGEKKRKLSRSTKKIKRTNKIQEKLFVHYQVYPPVVLPRRLLKLKPQ